MEDLAGPTRHTKKSDLPNRATAMVLLSAVEDQAQSGGKGWKLSVVGQVLSGGIQDKNRKRKREEGRGKRI